MILPRAKEQTIMVLHAYNMAEATTVCTLLYSTDHFSWAPDNILNTERIAQHVLYFPRPIPVSLSLNKINQFHKLTINK